MGEVHTCKSCGRQYEFLPTVTGKMMPVDVGESPVPGNMIVVDGVLNVVKTSDLPMARATFPPNELRTSHFATCPYARDYRKRHPVGEAKEAL